LSSSSRSPSVTVVVASHDEGLNLRRTVGNLLATMPPDGEIVVVDDASTDGSADFLGDAYPDVRLLVSERRLGSPRARNHGASAARGDLVVFADAHIEAPFGWFEPLASELVREEVGAVGPAVSVQGNPLARGYGFAWRDRTFGVDWLGPRGHEPHAVPMLGGFFLALRRRFFEEIGGFDDGLVIWGGEDGELCTRIWLLGHECRVVPSVAVAHRFRTRLPYLVHPEAVVHNRLRVAAVHFSRPALDSVIDDLRNDAWFPAAVARLLDGDASQRRQELAARRAHDDTWFFEQFQIGAFAMTKEEQT
jgi:GT2 family glycosyltransferase